MIHLRRNAVSTQLLTIDGAERDSIHSGHLQIERYFQKQTNVFKVVKNSKQMLKSNGNNLLKICVISSMGKHLLKRM